MVPVFFHPNFEFTPIRMNYLGLPELFRALGVGTCHHWKVLPWGRSKVHFLDRFDIG